MQVTLDSLLKDPKLALPPNWSECVVVLNKDQQFQTDKITDCIDRLKREDYQVKLGLMPYEGVTITISR